ncbi:50S ribosomal protein L11 methyltransferase [Saccharopolyspora sp. NPDC000995]
MIGTHTSVSTAAELLRRANLTGLLDGRRRACLNTWEPWLTGEALNGASPEGTAASPREELARLLHTGVHVGHGSIRDDVGRALVAAGLVTSDDGIYRTGRWRLSAFAGLLIAADRDYGTEHEVHLGEDSLRFAQAVLAAAPRGTVLDVGSGSGVSTAAAARTAGSVRAIDVLPDAVEATGLTCALNPGGAEVTAEVRNFADIDLAEFDHVIVNLPGVPVPAGMPYPTAGNGGPDGLDLIRTFWKQLAAGPPRRVTMRFQSMGGVEPEVLSELSEAFPLHTISIGVDSAVPMRLRDAITAERIAAITGADPDDVVGQLSDARRTGGRTTYFCSTMNLTPGGPELDYAAPLMRLDPEGLWRRGPLLSIDDAAVWTEYCSRLRLMPDEFWSVQGEEHVRTVGRDMHVIGGDLAAGKSPADVAGAHIQAGPAARVGLELAIVLLAEVLDDIGILRSR